MKKRVETGFIPSLFFLISDKEQIVIFSESSL